MARPATLEGNLLDLTTDLRVQISESDELNLVTPCCEVTFVTADLYRQHVERYERTGFCLGQLPDKAGGPR